MDNSKFVGTWELVRMRHELDDGSFFFPFGEGAIGQLVYTAEGFMAVLIMRANRESFASDSVFEGTVQEKKGAIESFMSYGGPYRVEKKNVVHVLKMSLFPNWIGNEEIRYFEFEGDLLHLSTPPFKTKGKDRVGRITWRKVRS